MESILAFFSIFGFIIYYSFFRVERKIEVTPKEEKFNILPRRSKKSLRKENKFVEVNTTQQEPKEKKKRTLASEETFVIRNVKELVMSSFKEGKDLISVQIQNEGKLILTSDVYCVLNTLGQTN